MPPPPVTPSIPPSPSLSLIRSYDSVDDYYAAASSDQRLASVNAPLLLLNAYDDPIVPGASLRKAIEVLADQSAHTHQHSTSARTKAHACTRAHTHTHAGTRIHALTPHSHHTTHSRKHTAELSASAPRPPSHHPFPSPVRPHNTRPPLLALGWRFGPTIS
jgi:hypothetical protein